MKNILLIIFGLLFTFVMLVFAFKGEIIDGKLDFQKTYSTRVGGPFELSNSTARYALTQAIVDGHTFFLTVDQGRFAAPDVVESGGKFMSIFTPGVSFLAIPFYMLGQQLGTPQIATYGLNILFALLSVLSISLLTSRMGVGKFLSIVSGLIFLFATNALPYSQTLTQHLISSVILISMLFLAAKPEKLVNLIFIGVLYSFGFLVDFPNAIMALPILFYVFFKQFTVKVDSSVHLGWKALSVLMFISMIPLLGVFGYYNFKTTGSYFKLAQSIGRTDAFNSDQPVHKLSEIPELGIESKTKSFSLKSLLPFDSRKQLNGFYILALSDERSWFHYSPILILGVVGLFMASRSKKYKAIAVLGISIVAIDYVLYSSFGDPWGGWAFGPRYLIPSAAISAVGVGYILEKKKSSILVWLVYIPLLVYSIAMNSLAVFTTIAVPPKIESVNLSQNVPYTEKYNFNLLKTGKNTSIVYQKYFSKQVTPQNYVIGFYAIVSFILLTLSYLSIFEKKKND